MQKYLLKSRGCEAEVRESGITIPENRCLKTPALLMQAVLGMSANVIGIAPPPIYECREIPNAAATNHEVLYNSRFMRRILIEEAPRRGGIFEGRMVFFVISHELGHVLFQHGSDPRHQHEKELEADCVAGFCAGQVCDSETLDLIERSMAKYNAWESETHPSLEDRIEAIRLGWQLGQSDEVIKFLREMAA